VIPFSAEVGGKEGTDYNAFVGTDFYIQGRTWGDRLVGALKEGGNVAYLGGPPGTSGSTDKSRGLHDAFKGHPNVKWIGPGAVRGHQLRSKLDLENADGVDRAVSKGRRGRGRLVDPNSNVERVTARRQGIAGDRG
jgi:hypothetical protein